MSNAANGFAGTAHQECRQNRWYAWVTIEYMLESGSGFRPVTTITGICREIASYRVACYGIDGAAIPIRPNRRGIDGVESGATLERLVPIDK